MLNSSKIEYAFGFPFSSRSLCASDFSLTCFPKVFELMKITALLLPLVVTGSVGDPCTRLCEIDGPRICTDGSYNKNGFCHRYLFRGDPALNDYCYHTSATAATCPGSGKPVNVGDAARLLGIIEGRGPVAAPPRVDAPPPPPDRLRREEPRVPTTVTPTTQRPSTAVNRSDFMSKPPAHRMNDLRTEVKNLVGTKYDVPAGSIKTARENALINSLAFLNGPIKPLTYEGIGVTFEGEPGYGIGMTKEWIGELTRQFFSPDSGFFELSDAAPFYYKISATGLKKPRAREIYKAAGRFLALSLLRNHPLGVNLPVMFFAKLLDQELTLNEVAEEEDQLVKSLRFILNLPAEDLKDYPITIDGVDVVPTMENREKLVVKKVNSLITPDVVPSFNLIKQGFNEVFPTARMGAVLRAVEVKALILGNPDIDMSDLLAHADIQISDEGQRSMFRNVLMGFTEEERRKFLRFATNLSQTPVGGFAQIQPRMTFYGGHREISEAIQDKMPRVFLCTHSMILPDYDNEEEMRNILTLAMDAGAGWK